MYPDRACTKAVPAGFTLIELMIVVAIVAILAVIAIPTYTDYVLRSNRVAAKGFLNKVALDEQRYYISNRSYGKLSALGGYGAADTVGVGENQNIVPKGTGLYDVTVTATTTGFTATATAKNRQASDTGCLTLTLDNKGSKSPAACWKK